MMLWSIFLWLFIPAMLFYFFKSFKQFLGITIELHKLPGPPGPNFIVGNGIYLHAVPEIMFQRLRKFSLEYYPIFKLWMGPVTHANIVSPEDFEIVMSNTKHNKKGLIYDFFTGWLGTGLLTSQGDKWQTRRKILTPAFHFNILQKFMATFNDETTGLVEVLKIKSESDRDHVVEINEHITQFTLKTIGETSMGTKFEFKSKSEIQYKKAIMEIGQIFIYRTLRPWLYPLITYYLSPTYRRETKTVKILHKFTTDVIAERQKNFKGVAQFDSESNTSKKRMAMLDLLLSVKQDEGMIDDDGIREEVDTFMFEGHDTTASAISFALMEIACHKEFQDKIVEEMREVLGDIKKKPTYQELQELKYLERCIKEVLRLYPSVWYIGRELGEDMVSNDGYFLPKGTIMHMHIYDLHRNPKIYPDPERFDPDRFLPENSRNRHPFAYVPFSAGPRNCIGQKFALLELKTALCGVLGNFVLEPVDTAKTIVLVTDLVLRTKDAIKVKFIPRVE